MARSLKRKSCALARQRQRGSTKKQRGGGSCGSHRRGSGQRGGGGCGYRPRGSGQRGAGRYGPAHKHNVTGGSRRRRSRNSSRRRRVITMCGDAPCPRRR